MVLNVFMFEQVVSGLVKLSTADIEDLGDLVLGDEIAECLG